MNEQRRARTVRQVDIAAAADCSQNTVTLALARSNRISAARRKQILAIAKKMGYRPNLTARNLRMGRSGLVGILTGALDEARTLFIGEILKLLWCRIML